MILIYRTASWPFQTFVLGIAESGNWSSVRAFGPPYRATTFGFDQQSGNDVKPLIFYRLSETSAQPSSSPRNDGTGSVFKKSIAGWKVLGKQY
jgi:hypothetical protein